VQYDAERTAVLLADISRAVGLGGAKK